MDRQAEIHKDKLITHTRSRAHTRKCASKQTERHRQTDDRQTGRETTSESPVRRLPFCRDIPGNQASRWLFFSLNQAISLLVFPARFTLLCSCSSSFPISIFFLWLLLFLFFLFLLLIFLLILPLPLTFSFSSSSPLLSPSYAGSFSHSSDPLTWSSSSFCSSSSSSPLFFFFLFLTLVVSLPHFLLLLLLYSLLLVRFPLRILLILVLLITLFLCFLLLFSSSYSSSFPFHPSPPPPYSPSSFFPLHPLPPYRYLSLPSPPPSHGGVPQMHYKFSLDKTYIVIQLLHCHVVLGKK